MNVVNIASQMQGRQGPCQKDSATAQRQSPDLASALCLRAVAPGVTLVNVVNVEWG